MNGAWQTRRDSAGAAQIERLLRRCDASFVPPLSHRVDLLDYAAKLAAHARLVEAWDDGELAGLVAIYCNDKQGGTAFVSNVSVAPSHTGRGIAGRLLGEALALAGSEGMREARLEVGNMNAAAIALYRKHGFADDGRQGGMLRMSVPLTTTTRIAMTTDRDYNAEMKDSLGHKYAYGFDFDVMHPYMIKSFQPNFRPGSLLELGSFKGALTRRLLEHFSDVTCVEASSEALDEARPLVGDRVQLVHARFEEVKLPRRYDNIVLTHVLEHLDDPVGLLRRINDEWLAPSGRLFLVCPNANAPSRQIAVKMGLIEYNAAVTPAEREHGHRITYSLDTLERDAVRAGLAVRQRSGIFFKALANFQWDRLLQTDIISPEYLDGCYALGQQYPDLCASIFLLCEQGPSTN